MHVVPARGGEPAELARLAGSCSAVSWSPDGGHVAFLGIDEAGEPYGCEDSLWVVPAAAGPPRDLAPGRHQHLHLTLACDLLDWEVDAGGGLSWDGPGAVISPLTLAGQTSLWRFPLDGEPEQVDGCGPHVHGYARGGGRIVTLRGRVRGRAPPRGVRGGRRRLTRGGTAWQRPVAGITYEQVSVPGPAGPIRATLVSPRGAGRKALPLVLSIIGGPGVELGARAVAARPGARRGRRARADARPARLGELRPRLAGGDPRRLGRRRRRGSARLRGLGGGRRASPIRRAWA